MRLAPKVTDEPGGLLAELGDTGGRILLQTDKNWRMTGRNGWGAGDNRQEIFDARLHPIGWNRVDFDDAAWSGCPAEFLTRNLIGLEILEPGCVKVRLNPAKTPFDYTVAYPTPKGNINVTCRAGQIDVRAPADCHVEIVQG